MAEVLPNSRVETISWFEQRVDAWAKNPAAIGLTSELVADLVDRLAAARAASDSALALRQAARAATGAFHDRTDDMRRLGADMIKMIRAFALTSQDPAVFAAALVPSPAAPTPAGVPEAPTDLLASVGTTGTIHLRWKASRAHNTQFIIERQMTPVGAPPDPFIFVGHSAANAFTDAAVPVGYASAAYRVVAIRPAGMSDASGPAVVNFGTVDQPAPASIAPANAA